MDQQPDTKPGFYYVSVVHDRDYRLLAGPYVNDHAAALADVQRARDIAQELDVKATWYAFGTCRTDDDAGPGILNKIGKM